MDKGIMAARKQLAMEKIQRKSGIDLSRGSLPVRSKNTELTQLYQLEKLARELPEFVEVEEQESSVFGDEILETIANVNGVGPALMDKIKKELADSF